MNDFVRWAAPDARIAMDFLRQLFGPGDFMPHGYCYLWNPGLVWLHVISDVLIAASYFTIPFTLLWFMRKRRDLPFSWMFGLFGTFIVACGATHVMEVWNLWHAEYWLAGVLKAVTAMASVGTAILLARLMPQALDYPSASQWIKANAALEREVRERRDLEIDLRIRENRYREQAELLEVTYDAVIVRNLQHEITYWNRGAEGLYGWRAEEILGKVPYDLLQTLFPKPRVEMEAQTMETGYWEGELTQQRRDGSAVIVFSRWVLRRDAQGNPDGILESNRDITAKREAEESLARNEERNRVNEISFRLLIEAVKDYAIIGFDPSGMVTSWNGGAERLKGYKAEEIMGQHISRLYAQEDIDTGKLEEELQQAAATGHVEDQGWRVRKDGSRFWAEVVTTALRNPGGKLIGFVKIDRDITARRDSEKQIRDLNLELVEQLDQLGNVNRELESFSYSVSHDLRAPLRHVDGFARILKDEYSPEIPLEASRYLDRILQGATRMGQLIDDLLNLAQIGRKELKRRKVQMGSLVKEVMAELPAEAQERSIEWRIEPLPEMNCDPGLVKIVFANLLANAVKFTRKQAAAVIEVGTRTTDGQLTIFVRDNGVGFDPRYADKLFGVFQRLHRQEDFEGTGIGLVTVQRIIRRHGGEVWAESQVDAGTTFFFTLGPLAQSADEAQTTEIKRA
ncbi:MAG TPA: PAS domain S-box protein [Candidatus Acidoferrales bacterium]|jgi:PAS domain S-box-containing protein|nr:PAS domain S-box protein [Candidatus Acidoferrales bacterium]